MRKVVLFATDGTISDSVDAVVEATNLALTARGFCSLFQRQHYRRYSYQRASKDDGAWENREC